MDLQKLFSTQKVLRDRINYDQPDRLNKLVLALLVELGECANEWRGFKFWSKNQKPRTKILCIGCGGTGELYERLNGYYMACPHCEGSGVESKKNPLLEEYVDGLHFVLELGLELNFEDVTPYEKISEADATEGFMAIYRSIVMLEIHKGFVEYHRLLSVYVRLGKILGFTWEQIEKAYLDKNKINHIRQDNGY